MASHYTIGLDFGTNSVRALLVDTADGRELGSSVWNYAHGQTGIILDTDQPDLARQHPVDYLRGIEQTVSKVLEAGAKDRAFSPSRVIGIGVDTTGSTPLPVDAQGMALALKGEYAENPNAMAWLWKDHTAHAEAARITAAAAQSRPQYLAKCGGRYSSEWYWSKLLHCARIDAALFAAAYTWVELADWVPAVLTGTMHPDKIRRGVCAAGHKAFYNPAWGGYPDEQFLSELHPELARIRRTLGGKAFSVAEAAGKLTAEWAKKLGLPEGIPVAIGAFDAHLGAVGAGIGAGTLVKIMGTSTCDIMISPMTRELGDIPGLCGIVPESVLPQYFGLEAGQSAVGDIFNWFVNSIRPGGDAGATHDALTESAKKIAPGESGLLALDWHNGNRTVLVDQRLSGALIGMSLATTPGEIYRALIEATAFGARVIMERLEEHGVPVRRVVNCGGIASRSPLAMQIYADVMNRPLEIARSTQTCALGSAIAGAVVAGAKNGGHDAFDPAVKAMTGVLDTRYVPIPENVAAYRRLYVLYRALHDAFGVRRHQADLSNVMKQLLDLRDQRRSA